MSLVSGFNVTPGEVDTLAKASLAAFVGGPVPAGWTVVTPTQLGLAPQYSDGNYFTNGNASAIVLMQADEWIVAFRGTDSIADLAQYPQLVSGRYIDNFDPLLQAVAGAAPAGTHFSFTGASLGGGATNQLAERAVGSGEFVGAHYVAFASPVITNANGILNVGFENDPIYKALNGYASSPSSLDHILLATPQFMAGNYDGRHPFDSYAHAAAAGTDALARIEASDSFGLMTPDAVVIVDASPGLVQDVTPGRESTGAFYIGEQVADVIAGRNGPDTIEGLGGDDVLDGGAGSDTAVYSGVFADYSFRAAGNGAIQVADLRMPSRDGVDTTSNFEFYHFADQTLSAADLLPSYRTIDTSYYLSTNGDVAASGAPAAQYYNTYDWHKLRDRASNVGFHLYGHTPEDLPKRFWYSVEAGKSRTKVGAISYSGTITSGSALTFASALPAVQYRTVNYNPAINPRLKPQFYTLHTMQAPSSHDTHLSQINGLAGSSTDSSAGWHGFAYDLLSNNMWTQPLGPTGKSEAYTVSDRLTVVGTNHDGNNFQHGWLAA